MFIEPPLRNVLDMSLFFLASFFLAGFSEKNGLNRVFVDTSHPPGEVAGRKIGWYVCSTISIRLYSP